jgi:hypothetical protein
MGLICYNITIRHHYKSGIKRGKNKNIFFLQFMWQ